MEFNIDPYNDDFAQNALDNNYMRITDEGGDDSENGFSKKPSTSIMDSIKAKSQVNAAAEDAKSVPWERPQAKEGFDLEAPIVTAHVQSAKLKQLLGKIKTS